MKIVNRNGVNNGLSNIQVMQPFGDGILALFDWVSCIIQLKRSLDPTQGKGKEAHAPKESGTEPKPQQRPQPQLQQTLQLS